MLTTTAATSDLYFSPHYQLTNDEPPQIISEQIFCQEGRGILIKNASMFIVDFDTLPSELLLTVEKEPKQGKVNYCCSVPVVVIAV